MTKSRTLSRPIASALAAVVLYVGSAVAAPVIEPAYPKLVFTVSGDCYAIGQQVAAQQGGTLAKATPSSDGQCVIVVLVPGKNGERPRRAEFVVPQN